jgi:hypothetical protein
MAQTFSNGESNATVRSKLNANAGEIDANAVAVASKEPNITAGTTAQYLRGDKSWQTLNKTAVGLSNVDNTPDTAKPVSTEQQAAIDLATATITRVLKTTITQSQILTLETMPVLILQNADITKYKYPISVVIKRSGAGTAYALSSNIYMKSNFPGAYMQFPADALTDTTLISVGFPTTSPLTFDPAYFASEFYLVANTSNPTSGTGAIDVYVTYIEFTL